MKWFYYRTFKMPRIMIKGGVWRNTEVNRLNKIQKFYLLSHDFSKTFLVMFNVQYLEFSRYHDLSWWPCLLILVKLFFIYIYVYEVYLLWYFFNVIFRMKFSKQLWWNMARTNGQELHLYYIGNLQNSAKLDGKRHDSELTIIRT